MPKKIGLVDDSLTIRTAFGLTFAGEDLGLQARSFASVDEAIKSGESLDVLYVDTKLGADDGYAACAKLRAQPSYAETPIVLVYGPWETFDEGRARAVGAVGGIQKPWDSEDMIQKVHGFLSMAPPAVVAGAAAAPARPAPAPAAPVARPLPPGAPMPAPTAQRVQTQIQVPARPGAFPGGPGAPPARPVPGTPTATHPPVGGRPAPGMARPAAMPLREFAQAAAPAAAKAVERKVAAEVPGLTPEQMQAVVKLISREVIEQVAWEVVPDLAEAIIREQIQALMKE